MTRVSFALLAIAAVPAAARAQGESAVDEIKAIFRLVEKDLDEIDRLLLSFDPAGAARRMEEAGKGIQKILDKAPPEGGKGGGEGEAGKSGGEPDKSGAGAGGGGSVKKVLEKAEARQSAVINGIQRILDKVPQGKGSKGGQDKPKDKDQQGQQQPDKQRGHDNPDYEKQQQEEQQRQRGEPQGNKQNPTTGTNENAEKPPPEGAKAQASREELDRLWGELPEYQRMQMMKQGAPAIPVRYQRYYEEFIRRSAKTRGK